MIIWQGENCNINAWVDGVPVESGAIDQLKDVAKLPFIFNHIAAMPDIHIGKGCCIGSVIPTKGAVIPSAVGVDIGCGMIFLRTSLTIKDIPENIRHSLRLEIEKLVPTGRTHQGGSGDKGAWSDGNAPKDVLNRWRTELEGEFVNDILKKTPGIRTRYGVNDLNHLGTLGGGNHFIEICVDLEDKICILLHSGSRGVGNRIGQYFIKLSKEMCDTAPLKEIKRIDKEVAEYFKSSEFKNATDKRYLSEQRRRESKREKRKLGIKLPNSDLSFFTDDTAEYHNYMQAVLWAQRYALINRELMMKRVIKAVENIVDVKFSVDKKNMIDCHHNYVTKETHYGEEILVTRKGAIDAHKGILGIIPGSMGAKSYIVEGLGNEDSFCSASHGAGRKMSRSAAKKKFTVEDHKKATEGIECNKSFSVIDETPESYKDIDTVLNAEKDLVKPITQIRQIICVKGSDE